MARMNNYEFRVLIKDKPITEYVHEDKNFVEGRKGSSFEIEFINKSYKRVLAIPSVDGINTLNGKDAGDESPGFVVNALTTVRIPGWTLDQNNVAKFMFEGKEHSYATHVSSSTKNIGVIGFRVFDELAIPQPYIPSYNPQYNISSTTIVPLTYNSQPLVNSSYNINDYHNMFNSRSVSNTATSNSIASSTSQQSVNCSATATATPQNNVLNLDSFNLGTGFGEKQDFATTAVALRRGSLQAQIVIYYDSYKNLQKRGINLEKPKKSKELPEAFPAQGCKPPPSWRG
jgi:hypothetical protein